jgi:hypothetical protein
VQGQAIQDAGDIHQEVEFRIIIQTLVQKSQDALYHGVARVDDPVRQLVRIQFQQGCLVELFPVLTTAYSSTSVHVIFQIELRQWLRKLNCNGDRQTKRICGDLLRYIGHTL